PAAPASGGVEGHGSLAAGEDKNRRAACRLVRGNSRRQPGVILADAPRLALNPGAETYHLEAAPPRLFFYRCHHICRPRRHTDLRIAKAGIAGLGRLGPWIAEVLLDLRRDL